MKTEKSRSVLKGAELNSGHLRRDFHKSSDITRIEVRRSPPAVTNERSSNQSARKNRDVGSTNQGARKTREVLSDNKRSRDDSRRHTREDSDDSAHARENRTPPVPARFSRYSVSPSSRHYSRSEKYFERQSGARRNGESRGLPRRTEVRRRYDSFDRTARRRRDDVRRNGDVRKGSDVRRKDLDEDEIFDKREVSGTKIVDLREKLKKKNAGRGEERVSLAVQIDNDYGREGSEDSDL